MALRELEIVLAFVDVLVCGDVLMALRELGLCWRCVGVLMALRELGIVLAFVDVLMC
jgi:hypothetical protein